MLPSKPSTRNSRFWNFPSDPPRTACEATVARDSASCLLNAGGWPAPTVKSGLASQANSLWSLWRRGQLPIGPRQSLASCPHQYGCPSYLQGGQRMMAVKSPALQKHLPRQTFCLLSSGDTHTHTQTLSCSGPLSPSPSQAVRAGGGHSVATLIDPIWHQRRGIRGPYSLGMNSMLPVLPSQLSMFDFPL